ncbi:unnamed protein product, partial [Candidula unifasciata]
MDLEQQLQKALKADQISSQMKASRLHTYWRKICEDERRAKQRNEMLMRDLERIDNHMAELNARTQSLALMKKQYEEYISKTYPKWNEFMNSSPQPSESATDPHPHDASAAASLHHQVSQSHSFAQASGDMKYKTSATEAFEKALTHQPEKDQQNQQQQNLQQHQWKKQQTIQRRGTIRKIVVFMQTHQVADHMQETETNVGVYANLPASQPDHHTAHKSQASNNVQIKSHEASTIQSHNAEKPAQPRSVIYPRGGQTEDDEEISDFGSESDLPMAQSLGNTKIPVTSPPDLGTGKSVSQTNGSAQPELSVDGLMNLLQLVESDMVEAFSCDDFYRRSALPLVTEKNDIIRKANNDGDLSKVDPSLITMVVLEQITHIVQTLTEKCLLPEELLQDTSGLSATMLRQHLSPEAQIIWDALYAHFIKLVQYDVLKPQEGHKFIVRLLEGRTISPEEHSPIHNNNKTTSPGHTMESSESFVEDDRVPPLKFGSLLEKHLSEDESSYVTSSLPQDPVPLNETTAYKSMVSGSGGRQAPRQMSGQDDTDDDVEKQIASALVRNPAVEKAAKKPNVVDDPSDASSQTLQTSPHVYVPTAMES